MSSTTRLLRSAGLFLLFLGTAVLLYQYSMPIIYGYHFQIAGLIMIVAMAVMGAVPALALAAVFGSLQWLIWDEPLFVWVLVLEMMFLALFQKRSRRNYLYTDAAFWILLGTPFVLWLAYLQQVHPWSNALLLLLISIVNGLFNALIGELLTTYMPAFRRITGDQPVNLNKVLSHLAIASVTIPFIIFAVIIGWYQSKMITERAANLTSSVAKGLEGQLRSWNEADQRLLRLSSLIQLGRLQEMTENYMNTNRPLQITITDSRGKPLIAKHAKGSGSAGQPAWMTKGTLYQVNPSLLLWLPKHSRYYSSADWENSYFVYDALLSGPAIRVQIEIPFSYFAKDIYYVYTVNFAFILGSMTVAALVCLVISRSLIRYVMNLIQATASLPEEIQKNRVLNLKNSPILELNWLKNNFNQIASKLSAMFRESEEMHRNLKQQTKELQRQEKLLSQLAFTDSLTQLPNRNCFMKYLQLMEESSGEDAGLTAFLFIDLDKFKTVNDTMGHAAGDELLREAALMIKGLSGQGAAYRLAGDEFVVVLEQTSHEEIDHICRRLLAAFGRPILIKDRPCELSLSIGVAVHPIDGFNFEQILNLSDKAMYAAKTEGGSKYVYYSDFQRHQERK